MKLTDLLEEFNVVIDTAEGLNELRSLILGLGVRGKLVPQDLNDEPASELLKKVEAGKERLYEKGEIRKPKDLPAVKGDEFYFDAPPNWKWTRLGEIGDWGAGATPTRSNSEYYGGDIPWLKTGELNDSYIKEAEEFITEKGFDNSSVRLCKPGDVLIAMYGATIGKLGILEFEATTNQACCACTTFEGFYNIYLYYYLLSMRVNFRNQGAGGAQPNISKTKIENTVLPLPPLAEQHRIVQKIESLFAEVDELEAKLNQQTKLDDKLQMAVNADVQQAQDADASQSAWTFITTNFDTLYHTPEAIDNLKKNILNEAFRGRLVPQDPNDEPASELLKKIESKKQRLYDEGEIRKPKKLPLVKDDDIPFEIPENWEWCRLGETCLRLIDGNYGESYPKKDEFLETGVPFFTGASVGENFNIRHHKTKYISVEKHKELTKAQSTVGDLIFINRGARVGGVAQIYEAIYSDCNIGPQVTRIAVDHKRINKDYVMFSIASPNFQSRIMDLNSGSAMNFMNLTKTSNMVIALPPLEEQHRIVRRIEELFAICDRFKAKVKQREKVNERLVKGLVKEVLGGSS